jgi:hypothetical protein
VSGFQRLISGLFYLQAHEKHFDVLHANETYPFIRSAFAFRIRNRKVPLQVQGVDQFSHDDYNYKRFHIRQVIGLAIYIRVHVKVFCGPPFVRT